jgi:hypothetical protein
MRYRQPLRMVESIDRVDHDEFFGTSVQCALTMYAVVHVGSLFSNNMPVSPQPPSKFTDSASVHHDENLSPGYSSCLGLGRDPDVGPRP